MIDARSRMTLGAFGHIISYYFFSLFASRRKHLSDRLGAVSPETPPDSLHDSAHKSLLQSGKERSDLANDCSTFLDEVWSRPPLPTHPAASHFSQPSIWHNRSKTSYQECGEQGIVVRVACSAKTWEPFPLCPHKCR